MIEIICGEKGTGKTKRIISLANGISDQAKGSMVFIDDDNSYMYDLGYSIRFINVTDYALNDPDMFLGFLCGMLSSNYDLTLIAVDAFKKLVKTDMFADEMRDFFFQIEKLSERHGCDFVFSIGSLKEDVPEFISKYSVN